MKKSLVFLAAAAIAFGTVSAFAVDKKPADATAATTAAPAADKTAAAPATDAAAPAATGQKQTLCPKCKRKIAKKFFVDAGEKRVYFCSSICADKMKKDIAGTVSKLEAEGIALDPADKKADKKKK
ncbi:MAG: hypothetical protein WCV67_03535 [Victivallaceae bacterium]|jgi:hypothetical protein